MSLSHKLRQTEQAKEAKYLEKEREEDEVV